MLLFVGGNTTNLEFPMTDNLLAKAQSLKETCVARIETWILSGEFPIGIKLPPEREFAVQLNVSRPVLHEALVELAARGLVTISPRHGVRVNDYQNTGSLALLDSLVAYREGHLDESFRQDLFAFRRLIESETAALAARKRSRHHLAEMQRVLAAETTVDCSAPEALTELDFAFHLLIARASGNSVYPLILNSFKGAYTSYTRAFFTDNLCSPVIQQVFDFHSQLVKAIQNRQSREASLVMLEMLNHGEEHWKGE